GELFSVRAIPLGGYCAFDGESDTGEESEAPSPQIPADPFDGENDPPSEASTPPVGAQGKKFLDQKPWKRLIVLVAGAFMNYLFALLIIWGSFFGYGQYLMVAYEVAPTDSVDAAYCLQDKDIFLRCEGRDVYLTTDLIFGVAGKKEGDLVSFTVSRLMGEEGSYHRETVEIEVMLRADATALNSADADTLWTALGIQKLEDTGWQIYVTPLHFGFFETLARGFLYSWHIAGSIFRSLGELFTGALGLSSMGGPITTIQLTAQIASMSFRSFLDMAALIGVNLAVFNLLPIPALDGSKVVFTLIEWIFRKPVNRKVEAIIHTIGLLLIFGFAIMVDILHFF
ncbi:MAG: M50 family metallopeptidase, partial [Christensenellaceae bacterium]